MNSSNSEKQITHQHYGTFVGGQNMQNIPIISPQEFNEWKIESLLLKYVVLLLSLVLITLDVKNIRNRIATQDDIVAEV